MPMSAKSANSRHGLADVRAAKTQCVLKTYMTSSPTRNASAPDTRYDTPKTLVSMVSAPTSHRSATADANA